MYKWDRNPKFEQIGWCKTKKNKERCFAKKKNFQPVFWG